MIYHLSYHGIEQSHFTLLVCLLCLLLTQCHAMMTDKRRLELK